MNHASNCAPSAWETAKMTGIRPDSVGAAEPRGLGQTSETSELDFLLMHLNEAKATALQNLEAASAISAALIGDSEPPSGNAVGNAVAGGGVLSALDREMSEIRNINTGTLGHLNNIRKAINA